MASKEASLFELTMKGSKAPAVAGNASTEQILEHGKAATGSGSQNQSYVIHTLKSEDFPALDLRKFDLYRPGDEGLEDFVVRRGEDAEEAVYYGEE